VENITTHSIDSLSEKISRNSVSGSCEPTKHFSTHFLPTARRVGVRRKDTTHADLFCKHCQVDDPSRLGGQKEPVYPVILLATHTGTPHFCRFFWARIGSEEQTAITEVLRTSFVSSSPECYREAVAAIQLDAGGCLRKYSGRTTVPILCIANKLDLIRNRREYTQLSLLLWCLKL
jgi:hypothetical protein